MSHSKSTVKSTKSLPPSGKKASERSHGKTMQKNVSSTNLRQGLGSSKLSSSKKGLSHGQLRPAGIIEDLVDTGVSVGKTVIDIAMGNPVGIAEVPSTLLKVIDTSKNVVRNLQKDDSSLKLTVPDKAEIKMAEDKVLVQKLQENMPVLTTTQIPGQNAYEFRAPPISQTSRFDSSIGRQIHRFTGSYNTGSLGSVAATPFWGRRFRLTPADATCFGPRMRAIAGTFQMFRINSFTLQYVPNVGTDFNGQVMLNMNEGTDLTNQFVDEGSAPQDVSQREHFAVGPYRQPLQLTIKGRGEWKYLYSSAGSEDLKWFSDMTAGVLHFGGLVGTSSDVGSVYSIFDVEFTSAIDDVLSFYQQLRSCFLTSFVSRSPVSDFDYFLKVAGKMADLMDVEDRFKDDRKIITSRPLATKYEEITPIQFLRRKRKGDSFREYLQVFKSMVPLDLCDHFLKKLTEDLGKPGHFVTLLKEMFLNLYVTIGSRAKDLMDIFEIETEIAVNGYILEIIKKMSVKLYDDRHPKLNFDEDEIDYQILDSHF